MKKTIDLSELQERIKLNFQRLYTGDYYKIDEVFAPIEYDWPGDKEGRALLAFVSHYKISGEKIPCMEQMLKIMPLKLNCKQYMGKLMGDFISEQQLSGHSWLLRGLCEHYEQFKDSYSFLLLNKITENLFLETQGVYSSYPINRTPIIEGDVSGNENMIVGNWKLSTDIGCAFMSIDGLSHVYQLTHDSRVKNLIDEMIDVFLKIDKEKLSVQTHCTLTAARGMMRMLLCTKESKYLDGAKNIFHTYIDTGMTYTYHNLNWWGRPDTWSEPCAIVDSLMLALELYKQTSNEDYRRIAACVYHNAFSTIQRSNGGAGTDTLVCEGGLTFLKAQLYEAHFCCTMRLAEGLCYIKENINELYAITEGKVTKKQHNIYSDGDILYAEVDGGAEKFAEGFVTIDGHKLCPIVKYFKVPREIIENSIQKICF